MDKTLETIQSKAGEYGQYRDLLTQAMKELNRELSLVKDEHYPNLKKLARILIKRRAELVELIKANASKFEKPRTQIFEGVKFGLQKQKGKLVWDDDETLVKAIAKLAASGALTKEQQASLVKISITPVASALDKLDAKLLKKLGVTVTADTDAVVLKCVDTDVEKALNALLKDAEIIDLEAEVNAQAGSGVSA